MKFEHRCRHSHEKKTNVSKTIWKAPLAEAQIAVGKQKYVLCNAAICPITKILRKTASSHTLKSDNRLLSYGQKTMFHMAAVRHLEFSKFRVYVMWPLWPCCSASLCKFHWNRTISCWVMVKTIFFARQHTDAQYTLWFKKTRQLWRTITTTQFSRF